MPKLLTLMRRQKQIRKKKLKALKEKLITTLIMSSKSLLKEKTSTITRWPNARSILDFSMTTMFPRKFAQIKIKSKT